MTLDQGIAFATLLGAFGLFLWGGLRHDVVAMLALLAVVLTGLVPFDQAFDGFAHPAVVTVAAVLILSRALQNAGIVDVIVRLLAPLRDRDMVQIGAQAGLIALLSGFMNNVGALALMLPVALRNVYRGGYPPALSLMPLAFASLLGGMVTLIGTPPNLIIAAFRARETGEPFAMFDFAPVGGAVALAGLAYIVFVGWRLLPADRRGVSDDALDIGDYIAEVRVDADGSVVAYSRLTGREIPLLLNAGPESVDQGHVQLIQHARERPASITVLFSREIEIRFDAEELASNGKQDQAESMLLRAEADAELAILLSQEQTEKSEAAAAMDRVRRLQEQNR